jgi:aminopeptidase N
VPDRIYLGYEASFILEFHMRTDTPQAIYLEDYTPPTHLIETVELHFMLDPKRTRVKARYGVKPNPKASTGPLILKGEQLKLEYIAIDECAINADSYTLDDSSLILSNIPTGSFTVDIETTISPTENRALTGLYISNGVYCTQCEAEGFRRITFHPDRPDVLSVYTTRIETDKASSPVLLSNGNLIEQGEDGERHFAVWHDPFPKPSYLFALVSGDLDHISDHFETMSGRDIGLRIYVERGKAKHAAYAMEALKRSMRFDEEAFGREYDLNLFIIVAVSDFNMGAMENKGLNVFNDRYILASPETATDQDYANIESVIAHEYFHNWTGNRITCRDWFQLCLKEGLTVFRDQEFTSTVRSRPVKRINDVRGLRNQQFSEDSGPLAHPVRPQSYLEINNFYTATVYEKGAEVIRVLKTLIGADAFARGLDLYFVRHDGDAATIEDFLACMQSTSGRDLASFLNWYTQAGTPNLKVEDSYQVETGNLTLSFKQSTPITPGQSTKQALVMPFSLGLIDKNGHDIELRTASGEMLERGIVEINTPEACVTFTNIKERPVLSLNRGFSVPINLTHEFSAQDRIFAMGHDSDLFNRWQAGQSAAVELIIEATRAKSYDKGEIDIAPFTDAFGCVLSDDNLEPGFRAEVARLPSETDIAREIGRNVDPHLIHQAHAFVRRELGKRLNNLLTRLFDTHLPRGPYSPNADHAGRRALANAALDLSCAGTTDVAPAFEHFKAATNMTDKMAALSILKDYDVPERTEALDQFYQMFATNALVLDKWFALQAASTLSFASSGMKTLVEHPSFTLNNPNRIRSVIGTFAMANQVRFNEVDGSGYEFVADFVLALDETNPQVAARLLGAFKSWGILESNRRAKAKDTIIRIARTATISKDVYEIATKSLQ